MTVGLPAKSGAIDKVRQRSLYFSNYFSMGTV